MLARYDSEARSLAIDLEADASHQHNPEVAPNVLVGVRDGRAVSVEVISCDVVGLDGLGAAAREFGLDGDALLAAARAAIAAPDRDLSITVN